MSEARGGAGRGAGTHGMRGVAGTRGVGRLAAMVIALVVVAFLLLGRGGAGGTLRGRAVRLGVGAEADAGTAPAASKLRPDSGCGDHRKTFTRGGAGTLTGGRLARWRWIAPPTTTSELPGDLVAGAERGFVHVVGAGRRASNSGPLPSPGTRT